MVKNHQQRTAMNKQLSRITLLLASVLTLGYSRAAGPVEQRTPAQVQLERQLDRALNKHIAYPVLERSNMNGEVFVSLVVNKEGRIEVLNCSSENERLKEYVLRKLSRIDIGENPDGIWRTTHLRLTFRPEHA
jgi:hypothetical protein